MTAARAMTAARRLTGPFPLLALLALAPPATGAQPVRGPHIEVELVAELAAVAPGAAFQVALRLVPDPHWHTYWQNPGDSGAPPRIEWELPAGAHAGPIQWPVPERIPVGPLVNYGYPGESLLLVTLTPPPALRPGQRFTALARASWLVCEEECIPGEATLALDLPVAGTGRADPGRAGLFARARERLPRPAPDWLASFRVVDGVVETRVRTGVAPSGEPTLFAVAPALVEHAAPLAWEWSAGELRLRQPASPYLQAPPQRVPMVLTVAGPDGLRGYAFEARQGAPAGAGAPSAAAGAPGLAASVGLAFLGGLALNLMPCVFPVLSLKALAMARAAGPARRELRGHALLYTLGLVLAFLAVAAALLALRASGEQVGWGFQLQAPWFVALLAYLMLVLGLALSGAFAIGARWMGAGARLAATGGGRGAFFTGVLAVVVASPCTAPFMGTALGFALTRPAPQALLVFAALGLGMASPFLALAAVPRLAAWLPRPGAWMETFKQALAFPLYLTAVWLLWVLGRQAGADAVAAVLAGMVGVGFGAWLAGRAQGARPGPALARAGALIGTLAALGSLASPALRGAAAPPADPGWARFDEARLAAELARGRTVLVNMTADWCITCLVNERLVLASGPVRARLAAADVAYLKGDWTRRDPRITAYLDRFGRSGVPLYVVHRAGEEPRVLPQVLTHATVLEALAPQGP
jgi:thiol:disulfide interchange protein DsbD